MNKRVFLRLAALLACASALAAARARPQPATCLLPDELEAGPLLRLGGDLACRALVNKRRELLGKVEDVVLDRRGDVAFLECSAAGCLKAGKQRFPVPWSALERSAQGQFVLDATQEDFAHSPAYTKQPDMRALGWWRDVERAYARHAKSKTAPPPRPPADALYLGRELRSRPVEDASGARLASVYELVVDPRYGRVALVVLTSGSEDDREGRQVAVPWEALEPRPEKPDSRLVRFTLTATGRELEQAPEFLPTGEGWRRANEPAYLAHVFAACGVAPYWSEVRAPEASTKRARD